MSDYDAILTWRYVKLLLCLTPVLLPSAIGLLYLMARLVDRLNNPWIGR